MKRNKLFWGLFFILAAVTIILSQAGLLVSGNLFTIILSIFMIPIIIEGVIKVNFWGIFFPAAVIAVVNAGFLGFGDVSIWAFFVIALFLSIGFSMIFNKHPYGSSHHDDWHCNEKCDKEETIEYIDDNVVSCKVSFGASSKYLHATSLQQVRLDCQLGAMKVFFDNTTLHSDGAVVSLDCNLGAIELYIPKTWHVINNINTVLGGIDEKGRPEMTSGSPTLTLQGQVQLGGISIIYV